MKRKEYIDWMNQEIDWRVGEINHEQEHGDNDRREILIVELAMLRICLNRFKGR
jgi:hypothetical protein